MIVRLDNIELIVSKKLFGSNVNIEYDGKTTLVINETTSRTIEVLKNNYEKIKSHYIANLTKNKPSDINIKELSAIAVKILLYYIQQYSEWRVIYTKSNYNILFYEKDFNHPTTHDMVILFLRDKYSENWKTISANYINMDSETFDRYWMNRELYFNK
jgi:hypothetical protein